VTVSQGTNRIIGTDPAALAGLPELLAGWSPPPAGLPGWDGQASERAARVLLAGLDQPVSPSAGGG
jgi:hypothetical protein